MRLEIPDRGFDRTAQDPPAPEPMPHVVVTVDPAVFAHWARRCEDPDDPCMLEQLIVGRSNSEWVIVLWWRGKNSVDPLPGFQ